MGEYDIKDYFHEVYPQERESFYRAERGIQVILQQNEKVIQLITQLIRAVKDIK